MQTHFCYVHLHPDALSQYEKNLKVETQKGLFYLAQALASSPVWADWESNVVIVVRPTPSPILGFFTESTPAMEAKLEALGRSINVLISHLRYLTEEDVITSCEVLAQQLVHRLGIMDVGQAHFVAIPRGGLSILGILSYLLNLRPSQLSLPISSNTVVVVDDCALSGHRFGQYIQKLESNRIIFAHLYSNSKLREAIEAKELRVEACLAAHDLPEYWQEVNDDEACDKGEQFMLSKLNEPRYWLGRTEPLAFPWAEPDRVFWNPVTKQAESGWRIVPPDFCLKNRVNNPNVSIQVQPRVCGSMRPTESAVFSHIGQDILVGNLNTDKVFRLTEVSARFWDLLVEHGNLEDVITGLLDIYDVEYSILYDDLSDLVDGMLSQGIIDYS